MKTRYKRRYSGNDSHLWPFTLLRPSEGSWRPIRATLDSGGGEDRDGGCHLLLHAFGYTLICELPQLIKPWRRWVDLSKEEWCKSPQKGYWDEHPREYGFSLSDGFLQVFIGAQTHDSDTTKNWCKHLPWTQWRFVRFSLYDMDGAHFWTQLEKSRRKGIDHFKQQMDAEEVCPSASFLFEDFDGEKITAKTHIEEREWKFGEGWFKWLSLFRKNKIHRTLDIDFSAQVGPEKGSWKGGTTGHSIEMLPNELHECAFRRYCEQEQNSKYRKFKIYYIGRVAG